ncbi:hypothetical protein GDO81_007042 [Engystomops pustulosus]|uniref:Uncharacterized protein n=1 Tax=Engystomops pustulosus TaxID=76066 RepID=A0AAV7D289_ENGPU|nr:hypothetical protein GDO81_007042 [Engystomops pustulosus]
MQAGGALDGQPRLPGDMFHLVDLSKASGSDLLPSTKLFGVKGPEQPHVPGGRGLLVHGAAPCVPPVCVWSPQLLPR